MSNKNSPLTAESIPWVLAELYNRSAPRGMGWLQAQPAVSVQGARAFLSDRYEGWEQGASVRIDYMYGRPLKVDLTVGAEPDFRLYDRDNGDGHGAEALRSALAALYS